MCYVGMSDFQITLVSRGTSRGVLHFFVSSTVAKQAIILLNAYNVHGLTPVIAIDGLFFQSNLPIIAYLFNVKKRSHTRLNQSDLMLHYEK